MEDERALKTGRRRAVRAAKALQRWTGVPACPVCAAKPAHGPILSKPCEWEPVGEESCKEIARDDGYRGGGNYHLLVVDTSGVAKACTRETYPLAEVLKLADRLPLPVAAPGRGRLWLVLERQAARSDSIHHALHIEA